MNLITAVKKHQGDKSYRIFAEEIGVSTTDLFHILERGRPAGITFLAAVANKFPELDSLVVDYLRSRHVKTQDES